MSVTPGDWTAKRIPTAPTGAPGEAGYIGDDWKIFATMPANPGRSQVVAEIIGYRDQPGEADARLMAASKALLEALGELMQVVGHLHYGTRQHAVEKAKAAMAQATEARP